MLHVSLYTPVYHHVMLLVVIGSALLYWSWQAQTRSLAQFNQVAMIVIGFGVALFMGFRPISGIYFVDMGGYATEYERVRDGNEGRSHDVLFNVLMRLCAPVLPATGFFFVCALIYIAPLAVASWRVHGVWAFPVFLAFLTAFCFWPYGTNGIRNGMAMSVLILAFAFHDKPVVMFALMAAAYGFHGSTILPAGAFFIVRFIKRTEIWLGFWTACVALTLIAGNVGEMVLSLFNPFVFDYRVGTYILGPEQFGFRADFLAYSIVPVLVTLLLAAPTRARTKRLVARVMSSPSVNWMRNRSAMSVKGTGRGRLAGLHGASPVGNLALAGFEPVSHDPRSALEATFSTLNPSPRRSLAKAGRPSTLNSQPSTRDRSVAMGSQPVPERHDNTKSAWGQLPWVRMLRSDPFYARLVNTYLLANGIWVLLIHSLQSNRFAYLSWFMMPWVLLYPFVPGRSNGLPRTGLIAAVLCAHYLFTYVMQVVVYPLRGLQF